MRPTFINVGPGRCGTSWMHQALRSHPEISMASIKETEYFNNNLHKGLSWYESKFPESCGAVGEISNNYYLDPEIALRIADYNADIKIIFNLREPESLLRSMYAFAQRRGLKLDHNSSDLEIPVGRVMGSGYDVRLRSNNLAATDKPTLFEAALLSRFMSPYVECFDTSQIYFFILERMREDPATELARLYRFLGVSDTHVPDMTETKVNDAVVPTSKTIARLASAGAYGLRRVGADRLLTSLHDSQSIKSLLFTNRESREVVLPTSDEQRFELVRERALVADLVPAAKVAWNL